MRILSSNNEMIIWSFPQTKGFFRTKVIQERQITNLRVIQGDSYIGLTLLDDIVVMNQHRVSNSSYASFGGGGYSPRIGTGSSSSKAWGDIAFIHNGKPFIIFRQIPDPQGVTRLAKAARKRLLEDIKVEEKMNRARLQEEEKRLQQQHKERISLPITSTSNKVITCPRCNNSANTEGSRFCNNCGFKFADAPSSPSSSLIKTIEKNAGKLVTLKLPAYGVKINYPSKWEIDNHPEPPNFIIFKSPIENSSDTLSESVAISSFNTINETPEQVMQGIIIILERENPDFALIESVPTKLAGRQAHRIVCDFGGKRYGSIVTIKKDLAYQITYVAEPSKYDIYLPTVQKMVNSFKIK
jgi:hypothetical protein